MHEIEREGKREIITLIHYLAQLKKDSLPQKGEWKWFSLEEVSELDKKEEFSSPNIKLAVEYFSKLI